MVILKAESKCYKHMLSLLSLHAINALIRAVENVCFAKIDFGEIHIFNGFNQRINHT